MTVMPIIVGVSAMLASNVACGDKSATGGVSDAGVLSDASRSMGTSGTGGSGGGSVSCPVGTNSLGAEVRVTCLDGTPFVYAAWPYTDASVFPGVSPTGTTTATISTPKPGKICMSGRMENGFASMTLSFVPAQDVVSFLFANPTFANGLDAPARGVSQIRLTVDSPPAGTQIQLRSVLTNCGSDICIRGDFYWSAGAPPTPVVIDGAGVPNQVTTVTTRIADFRKGPGPNPDFVLGANNLVWLHVGPGDLAPMTGDYSFCVHDLAFLNENGGEVRP